MTLFRLSLFLGLLCAASYPMRAAEPAPKPAPPWALKDLDGNPITSSQFKGKVLVIDFWATWCLPCRKEIPGFIALQKKYAGEGLAIVGISTDQAGLAVVKKFTQKQGINYPVGIDDSNVQIAFGGLDGVPTTFIIDREGNIRDRKEGFEAVAEIEKKLLPLLHP
jgi:thiol-disulfide isomerase/thioredoxin